METAGEVLYITCNFIDDEWNLHRFVYGAYLVLPPGGDHCNAPPTLLVSRDEAGEYLVSCMLDDDRLNTYCPHMLMVAGEMTGSIGRLELKRLMDQILAVDGLALTFCTTNMDHVLHSISRCLVPYSNHVPNSQWATQDCQRLLSELGLDDQLESNEHVVADHLLFTLDSQTLRPLGAINDAIERVSAASHAPTSNLCLEELLKVRGALQSQLSAPGAAAHVSSLTKALEIVDKAIDDSYLLWSVPLVLDPRYKLRRIQELFPKAFDDSKAANYISRVRSMVQELYNEEMMALDQATKTDLDDYLNDSCARTSETFDGFDILNWWKVFGSVQYPTVAPMARAALAMPTCSKLTSDQTAQVNSLIRGHTKI